MKFFDKTVRGEFLSRPNRFTVLCNLHGRSVSAFLPNPGRLWELMIPGAPVYLERTRSQARKLKYTVVAVLRAGTPVMLHTHKTNDVARALIEGNLVPGLEGYRVIRREIGTRKSRFDFLLRKGSKEIYLEVKSCTLFGKRMAMFPDAVTERGKRHLVELAGIEEKGKKGALLFIVHCDKADFFLPEYHTDLEFSRAFLKEGKGLSIIPVAVGWRDDLTLKEKIKPLKIPWKVLEREGKDRGSYLIILRLPKKKDISVGKLGKTRFQKGYYIYTGSARKNLSSRVNRHKRLRKNHFWHIDYLREEGEFVAALPVRTEDAIECRIAGSVREIGEWEVPSFGSSDCACSSHLSGMDENPLQSAKFHEVLQYFRMDRLVEKRKD